MTAKPSAYNALLHNILKTRDDARPVSLARKAIPDGGEPIFSVAEHSGSAWARSGTEIRSSHLRERIEPWLTALCQSEHLSLLLGSGLTQAVHRIATGEGCPGMETADFGRFSEDVDAEADRSARAANRETPNLEDQLRAASELLRGYEILGNRDPEAQASAGELRAHVHAQVDALAANVLSAEQGIIGADAQKRESAFNYLVSFLMSFASRTGTRDRLHVFTTNYDRLIEAGAEAAGLHLLGRFVGSLAPVFRSSRLDIDLHYNPPGIRGEPRYLEGVARFTKLHGSLDWVSEGRDIRRAALPFGARSIIPYLNGGLPGDRGQRQLMIYPNAAKDRETAAYPYVELFRDLASAACRPNHTLITFGYSFGDEHINRVIEDMLTIPSTHLVAISYDDRLGRIMDIYRRLGRDAQISLLIGDHIGEFQALVENYLPKPAIDKTTFRMAELLKARWNSGQGQRSTDGEDQAPAGVSA
jgi:hypothetical protein